MLVRIAIGTASTDLGLHCFSRPFWKATGVKNFRISTVHGKTTLKVN